MNPWRDDPEGDARFTDAVGRIDAVLTASRRSRLPAMVGFALVMTAALQAVGLVVLL